MWSPEYLFEHPGLETAAFALAVGGIRALALRKWRVRSPGRWLELLAVGAAEFFFMWVWVANERLFRHPVVLLSGFACCLGLSLLGHLWVLRKNPGRHFERALVLSSLFFPGIYAWVGLRLVFLDSWR